MHKTMCNDGDHIVSIIEQCCIRCNHSVITGSNEGIAWDDCPQECLDNSILSLVAGKD